MATKKEKREAVRIRTERRLGEEKALGLEALRKDRENREKQQLKAERDKKKALERKKSNG